MTGLATTSAPILGAALAADGPGPRIARAAQAAEAAGVDFVTLGYPARSTIPPAGEIQLDPLSVAAALMTTTRHIGLCAMVPTLYWEPFNVARAFSTLDNLSGGRAAWHADTVPRPEDLANFSTRPHHDPATAYARSREFLEVVLELWDSWEDDAIVLDRENARFTDARKVHRINHRGPHFTVEGPLNAPRPVQGHPPVVFADPSEAGVELAAAFADLVIARPAGMEEAVALKARLGRARLLVDIAAAPGAVDRMDAWFMNGACDGFHLAAGAATDLVPELRRRGLVRAPPAGGTLRDRLGLRRPASRYAREVHAS